MLNFRKSLHATDSSTVTSLPDPQTVHEVEHPAPRNQYMLTKKKKHLSAAAGSSSSYVPISNELRQPPTEESSEDLDLCSCTNDPPLPSMADPQTVHDVEDLEHKNQHTLTTNKKHISSAAGSANSSVLASDESTTC